MRKFLKLFMIGCVFILPNSCKLVAVCIMSIDEKKTIAKWKNDTYKTRIQSRQGWVGPRFYKIRIQKQLLGGLLYQTIIKEPIHGYDLNFCLLKFKSKKDSIAVNYCKKKTYQL